MKKKEILFLANKTRNFIITRYKSSETFCAISSSLLSVDLHDAEIKHEIVGNNRHVFLKLNDYILDVTADQFGFYDQIEFFKISNLKEHTPYYWNIEFAFKNYKELVEYQNINSWPLDQIINQYHFKAYYKFDNWRKAS